MSHAAWDILEKVKLTPQQNQKDTRAACKDVKTFLSYVKIQQLANVYSSGSELAKVSPKPSRRWRNLSMGRVRRANLFVINGARCRASIAAHRAVNEVAYDIERYLPR